MFGTQGVEEKVFESKYIEPGIHLVTIESVEGVEPEGKSSYLEIKFKDDSEKEANIRFYMSSKAIERSIEKILHIGTKLMTKDKLDAIQAESLEDYGSALNQVFSGRRLRMKFTGEEVDGANGRWWKAGVGLPPFAEAIESGAHYDAIVDDAKSKLKFDKTNQYDYKPLPTPDTEDVADDVAEAPAQKAPF